jgi:hypothetical protein
MELFPVVVDHVYFIFSGLKGLRGLEFGQLAKTDRDQRNISKLVPGSSAGSLTRLTAGVPPEEGARTRYSELGHQDELSPMSTVPLIGECGIPNCELRRRFMS